MTGGTGRPRDGGLAALVGRRRLLALGAGAVGGTAIAAATGSTRLLMNGGPAERALSAAYPGKTEMIVQRVRAPLLETPMAVFDEGVFTPNDRFFVRWHWEVPAEVDTTAFRLTVDGAVQRPVAFSLAELLAMPRVEVAAVNQCAGNSRALFEPRVSGAQWSHGAMGNARWEGVPLRTLLDRAGVKAGATAVRFSGLDQPLTDADDYAKSIPVDVARSDLPFVAFAMNGEQLPVLNGFPLRLVIPGWYSTYWVKALDRIEVLDRPDENFWTAKAYRVPTGPRPGVTPGTTEFDSRPISTMPPRSFITNIANGQRLPAAERAVVRGIAMGGASGVSMVELSADNGRSWQPARLGPDEGRYGFRRFEAALSLPRGPVTLLSRCTNMDRVVQPMDAIWNPSGYARGSVEAVHATVA